LTFLKKYVIIIIEKLKGSILKRKINNLTTLKKYVIIIIENEK